MIDHLVYATPDLPATIADIEKALGITPVVGGRHLGRGTWNALVSLAPSTSSEAGAYLELIGPDPDQPNPPQPRPFGVDDITEPTLVAWAARTTNIAALLTNSIANGFDPGPAIAMQRETPEGKLLSWRLTFPLLDDFDGVVPFVIDWGSTIHPSLTTPRGAQLSSFVALHPKPSMIQRALTSLQVGNDIEIVQGSSPALRAVIRSPSGALTL
jgi:hypothetical protein